MVALGGLPVVCLAPSPRWAGLSVVSPRLPSPRRNPEQLSPSTSRPLSKQRTGMVQSLPNNAARANLRGAVLPFTASEKRTSRPDTSSPTMMRRSIKVMATKAPSPAYSWAGAGAPATDAFHLGEGSPTRKGSLAAILTKARAMKGTPRQAACEQTVANSSERDKEIKQLEAQRSAEDKEMANAVTRLRTQLAASRDQAMEGLALGDWNMYEEAVSTMIRLTPHDDRLYTQRARARLILGLAEDSEADARQAIRLCPSSPRGHMRLARVLCERSRLVEAGDEIIESRFLGDESSADAEL